MPKNVNTVAPASAPATRAESVVVREMLSALTSVLAGMVSAISALRTPRSEGRTSPIRVAMISTTSGVTAPSSANVSSVAANTRVSRPHAEQQRFVPEAVADDAVDRRDQGAEILQRAEHREPEHRSGLDQHVPGEDDRLHLERPRGEQIGRPLETEAARRERRKHREARDAGNGRVGRIVRLA